ncbi:hypothetical protein ABZ590_28135, partial [Streptomyces hirsutus]
MEAACNKAIAVGDPSNPGCAQTTPERCPCLQRHQGITARDYGQAVPVVVTTLEQLTEHGAGA